MATRLSVVVTLVSLAGSLIHAAHYVGEFVASGSVRKSLLTLLCVCWSACQLYGEVFVSDGPTWLTGLAQWTANGTDYTDFDVATDWDIELEFHMGQIPQNGDGPIKINNLAARIDGSELFDVSGPTFRRNFVGEIVVSHPAEKPFQGGTSHSNVFWFSSEPINASMVGTLEGFPVNVHGLPDDVVIRFEINAGEYPDAILLSANYGGPHWDMMGVEVGDALDEDEIFMEFVGPAFRTITLHAVLPGDNNEDGTVDLTDLNNVLFNWNGHNSFNLNSLNAVLFNWGQSAENVPSVIPEPSSGLPGIIAVTALLGIRFGRIRRLAARCGRNNYPLQ